MTPIALALLLPTLAPGIQGPFPPQPPLFPLYGLGVRDVAHARASDLDGDGHVDVVTCGETAVVPLRIHLGTGDGSLRRDAHPPQAFPSGQFVRSLTLGDFDGDGRPEAAMLADLDSGSRIFIFENDGSGAMALREIMNFFAHCDRLTAVDFDGDGLDDLVFQRDPQARVNIARSLGAAGFAPPLIVPLPPGVGKALDYVLGDTTGDGKLDLLTLHGSGQRTIFQYVNLGSGGLLQPALAAEVPDFAEVLALGDVRGNGVLQLIVAGWDVFLGPTVTTFRNDGGGQFEFSQRLNDVHFPRPEEPRTGDLDLDGDGRAEWLVWKTGLLTERLVALDGLLTLADAAPRVLWGRFMQAADFDSDGLQDVLAIDATLFSGELFLALGDGKGSLADVVESPGQGAGQSSLLAHLDGDSDLDLVSFDSYPPRLFLYEGLGAGKFAWRQGLTAADDPLQVVTGDFDGDGLRDLGVVEGPYRSVELFLQGSDGTFASVGSTAPTQGAAGGFLNAVALDSDGDGRDELALLDPLAKRLFLVGPGTASDPAILGALDIPGAHAIHAAVESPVGGPEALEILAQGSASYLSLWVLEQPLAPGATAFTERLALPIQDAAPAWPVTLVHGIRVQDLDGDGLRDVWAVHHEYRGNWPSKPFYSVSSLWRGADGAQFAPAESERSTFIARPLGCEDLDGDGALERLLLFDPEGLIYPFRLQIDRGAKGAPFEDPENYIVHDVARGDVDGDGYSDLAFALGPWVFTLLNRSGR